MWRTWALAGILAAGTACNGLPADGEERDAHDLVAAPKRAKKTAAGDGKGSVAPATADAPAVPGLPGAASAGRPSSLYGVTVDTVEDVEGTVAALKGLPKRATTRVVFQPGLSPNDYAVALPAIHAVSDVMGTFLDSSGMSNISTGDFTARTHDFLDAFAGSVDLWEVGNEINGNWLGETADVVEKMTSAYDIVKARGGRTALTLFACSDSDAEHDMFEWALANVPVRMRTGLDYVLLSYYDGDCGEPRSDWQQVFDRLRAIFPTAGLGFGEVGAVDLGADISDERIAAPLLEKYYHMPITTPGYVGGHFWWYFAEDMVPMDKPMYRVLHQAMQRMR